MATRTNECCIGHGTLPTAIEQAKADGLARALFGKPAKLKPRYSLAEQLAYTEGYDSV